jgi:predicted NUDIX family NTP pyrophosphohydrolase
MARPASAGILLFRLCDGIEVLLVKPGGPFWRNKDAGAWMIPKGMIEAGESAAEAALREFREETGVQITAVPFPLCTVRQAGGKQVEVFAVEGDFVCETLTSTEFEMEWPPRSGRLQRYPEVAEAQWMRLSEAREKMLPSQLPMLEVLENRLSSSGGPASGEGVE